MSPPKYLSGLYVRIPHQLNFSIPNHKLNWISTYRSLYDSASKQRKTEQPNRHVLTVRALKYSSKSQIYSVSRLKIHGLTINRTHTKKKVLLLCDDFLHQYNILALVTIVFRSYFVHWLADRIDLIRCLLGDIFNRNRNNILF